jgi:hypothetical protein
MGGVHHKVILIQLCGEKIVKGLTAKYADIIPSATADKNAVF